MDDAMHVVKQFTGVHSFLRRFPVGFRVLAPGSGSQHPSDYGEMVIKYPGALSPYTTHMSDPRWPGPLLQLVAAITPIWIVKKLLYYLTFYDLRCFVIYNSFTNHGLLPLLPFSVSVSLSLSLFFFN